MGKQKLCMGVLLGAIAGGMAALCDKETRYYAKGKLGTAKSSANYYLKHPTEALRNVQNTYNQFNENINTSADNAINAIEQVEETVYKITKKKEGTEQLETTM